MNTCRHCGVQIDTHDVSKLQSCLRHLTALNANIAIDINRMTRVLESTHNFEMESMFCKFCDDPLKTHDLTKLLDCALKSDIKITNYKTGKGQASKGTDLLYGFRKLEEALSK